MITPRVARDPITLSASRVRIAEHRAQELYGARRDENAHRVGLRTQVGDALKMPLVGQTWISIARCALSCALTGKSFRMSSRFL